MADDVQHHFECAHIDGVCQESGDSGLDIPKTVFALLQLGARRQGVQRVGVGIPPALCRQTPGIHLPVSGGA
jgi:hypothetical protein